MNASQRSLNAFRAMEKERDEWKAKAELYRHALIETQAAIELASSAINDDKRGDCFRDILNAIYMKSSAIVTPSGVVEDINGSCIGVMMGDKRP